MAKGRSKQKAGKFRLPSLTRTQAVVALITSILGVAGTVIGIFTPLFKSSTPEFHLVKGAMYHPDSTIIVRAMNRAAKKDQPLIFEIDDYQPAMVQKDQEHFIWRINLLQVKLPVDAQRDGPHHVRFGFAQSKMSQPYKICFDSKPPATYVGYESQSPTEKRIFGQVIDDNPDQNISVEVAFQHEEKLQKTMLPVKSYIDSSGRKMYEFEYQIQNIPQLSQHDPSYNQPFFAIKVSDEAGNEFHHTSTYNSFIVEGVQTFGTKAAEILFQKIDDEKVPVLAAKTKLLEPKEPTRTIAAGPPLITLRVVIRTPNMVVLNWNRLPDNLRAAPEQYVMIRQNQELGTSFDTTYTDRSIVADSAYQYQVLVRGSDDKYYPSNIVPILYSEDSKIVKLEKLLTDKKWEEALIFQENHLKNRFDIVYYIKGRQSFEKRDFQNAEAYFYQANYANPKCANAYLWLGIVKEQLGDSLEAFNLYKRVLELDPNNSNAKKRKTNLIQYLLR